MALSESEALVFDRNRNVLMYKREARPTKDEDRGLELAAGIRWDEEVTRAVTGDLTLPKATKEELVE